VVPTGEAQDGFWISYQNRAEAALEESQAPVPRQITNGDEQRYPNFIGNFSKGLPHNALPLPVETSQFTSMPTRTPAC
jgi:hypothetical protein